MLPPPSHPQRIGTSASAPAAPPRRIRYLTSEGIHPREIRGLAALDQALPAHWVFYAGLEFFPRHSPPIEIDLVVLTDDRILLVEFKDWRAPLKSLGNRWMTANGRKRDSPTRSVASKARKLKDLIGTRIPGSHYVDSCVVLTDATSVAGLSQNESLMVLSLNEACGLGIPKLRRERLARLTIGRYRNPLQQVDAFDLLFEDRKVFRGQEADFSGFRIVEARTANHPSDVWVEHRSEERTSAGTTALLRCWDFTKLKPAMNSQPARRALVGRERAVLEHLNAVGSRLADGTAILRRLTGSEGAIAVDHHDLLALPSTWTQLSRYVVRTRGALALDARLDLLTNLVGTVAELHDRGVAHCDLSPLNIWIGGPERLGLTGFVVARLPGTPESGDDVLLAGYGAALTNGSDADTDASPIGRDVHRLGLVARLIADGAVPDEGPAGADSAPELVPGLDAWLTRATMQDAAARFSDARGMADELARLRAAAPPPAEVEESRLTAFRTSTIPFSLWPTLKEVQTSPYDVYRSKDQNTDQDVLVKVWPTYRVGEDFAADLEALRLLEGVSRLKASPVPCVPRFLDAGLSRVGPYLVVADHRGLSPSAFAAQMESAQLPLDAARQLMRAVRSLHAASLAHAELSSDKVAIAVDADGTMRPGLLGLFDPRLPGTAPEADPDEAPQSPADHGARDRLAIARVALELVAPFDDRRLDDVRRQLDLVLETNGATALDFSIDAADTAISALSEPPLEVWSVVAPDLPVQEMCLEEGLTVRAFDDHGTIKLTLTTVTFEMWLRAGGTGFVSHGFTEPTFRSLVSATSEGVAVKMRLLARSGAPEGIKELYEFLIALPALQPRLALLRNRRSASPRSAIPTGARVFPIKQHWRRVLEIEQELLPELEVGNVTSGPASATFGYVRIGGDFDFDPQDVVEVSLVGRPYSIGTLELVSITSTHATVVDLETPLKKGDRLRLTSRRGRPSFDRRRRAVDRILRGDAEIDDLLGYFDPSTHKVAVPEAVVIDRDEIARTYDLNEGQARAFEKIWQNGPVGLLQGPPGTGKTRFIAAFVHWLLTKGGAGKVLVVSQSHEAVNAALETLIDRFRGARDRLGLLRIGTKGITEKIRPFHSEVLRERYRSRFDGAMKVRVAAAAAAVGISRRFAHDVVEVERTLASLSRRLTMLEDAPRPENESRQSIRARERKILATQAAFKAAGERLLGGTPIDPHEHIEETARAFRLAQTAHAATDADMKALLKIIEIAVSWLAALSTSHRNFDEFLARTRAVVAGTCVGIGQASLRIDTNAFDWVIVDEAARCTSGELAVAAQLGRRLLLVGDQRQLPPMLDQRFGDELTRSFPDVPPELLLMSEFERAFEAPFGVANRQVLFEQYRMHASICDLVGDVFYKPFGVHLATSPNRQVDPRFERQFPVPLHAPVVWLDTSKAPGNIDVEGARKSRRNQAETNAAILTLEALAADEALIDALAAGNEETPIGIICMYSAQRDEIERAVAERPWRSRFRRMIKIETVDSYQGKENTVVIVSLTRASGSPGHVAIPNRCNVALSRARERVIVIGAARYWRSFTPSTSPMTRVLQWIEADTRADVVDVVSLETGRHG